MEATSLDDNTVPGPREFTRGQRRVLGVLLEKAFTTPDVYPLTVKACTSGCNQKNNRDPVTNYSEEQVRDILDELREVGVAAVVHTDGGRAERFRHYMRKRYTFSEVQLAILTELLLRGRQQPGELRTRASRMTPIENQETLRAALADLQAQGFVQANGPLDRRGVEVDHTFYLEGENQKLSPGNFSAAPLESSSSDDSDDQPVVRGSSSTSGLEELKQQQAAMAEEMSALREKVSQLSEQLDELRRALGM
ncbi:MAG: DUF480 domain-containing protein [Planctomycetaceae bacterium]